MIKNRLLLNIIFGVSFLLLSCSSDNVDKANQLLDIKAYNQAIDLLEKETQENPNNFDAHFSLANALACKAFENIKEPSLELVKKSISSYKSAAMIAPEEFNVHYNLGIIYLKDSKRNEAREKLNKACELNPKHSHANLLLSALNNNQEDSKKYLNKIIETMDLESNWQQLNSIKKRNDLNKGSFIVITDTAYLYRNNSKTKFFYEKYDVYRFSYRKQKQLFFSDKENPVYVTKQAYTYGKNSKDLYGRIVGGWVRDLIPRYKIKPNSIVTIASLGWGHFSKRYKEIVYLDKSINIQDVIIGSGNLSADKELVSLVAAHNSIDPGVRDNILKGFICKGLHISIVGLQMENLTLKEFMPRAEKIITIYSNDIANFTFHDGILNSWKENPNGK